MSPQRSTRLAQPPPRRGGEDSRAEPAPPAPPARTRAPSREDLTPPPSFPPSHPRLCDAAGPDPAPWLTLNGRIEASPRERGEHIRRPGAKVTTNGFPVGSSKRSAATKGASKERAGGHQRPTAGTRAQRRGRERRACGDGDPRCRARVRPPPLKTQIPELARRRTRTETANSNENRGLNLFCRDGARAEAGRPRAARW